MPTVLMKERARADGSIRSCATLASSVTILTAKAAPPPFVVLRKHLVVLPLQLKLLLRVLRVILINHIYAITATALLISEERLDLRVGTIVLLMKSHAWYRLHQHETCTSLYRERFRMCREDIVRKCAQHAYQAMPCMHVDEDILAPRIKSCSHIITYPSTPCEGAPRMSVNVDCIISGTCMCKSIDMSQGL